MPSPEVITQIEETVATVTLDHPPANIIVPQLLERLAQAFEGLRAERRVKAIVLTGAGSSFAAGADIKTIAAITSAKEGESLALQGQAIFNQIEQMPIPVIAAISGFCLGGGLELAMSCHLRIAGDRAKLGQPEINLGIMPGFGGTQRLTRIVGRSQAMTLILTGDIIGAEQAHLLGLVDRVVPEAEALKQAQRLARRIASKGRKAIEASLRAICEGAEQPLVEGLRQEAQQFGTLCITEDKKEGLSAFLEKRQPKFQDR